MTKRNIACVLGALLISAVAWGEPKTAEEWFKDGSTQYDLGNFDKAAESFKQAFAAESNDSKRPAYLYNVAQAYRQGGRCKDAAFFYKRFLALKEQDRVKPLSDAKRQETDQLVQQMEECAKDQEAKAGKPPTTTMRPEDGTTGTGTTTTTKTPTGTGTGTTMVKTTGTTTAGKTIASSDGNEEGDPDRLTRTGGAPKMMSARFELGASKVSMGDLSVPVHPAFSLVGGYPIQVNPKLRVEPGLAILGQPMGFKNMFTMASSTATLVSIMANGSGTYEVAPKISARGDLGAGVLMFGGISDPGSPFTQGGAGTSGTLAMFALRLAASLDYEITPNIVGTVTPLSFTYSPAKTGLRDDIKSINQFDFMVGIGYRM